MGSQVYASVVITTRNRHGLLLGAVRSALECRISELEVVVVDDSSEDETAQVMSSFQEPRLRFERLSSRRGRVGARNYAVGLALGEVIVFLDDDDQFLEGGLEGLIDAMRPQSREVAGVYGVPRYVSGNATDGYSTVEKPLPGLGQQGALLLPLLSQNFIQPGAVIVRKQAFWEAGGFTGDVEPIALEDWRLWLQLASRGGFAFLEREVVQILRHEGNTPDQLFTQSKCEYFGSLEFQDLLERVWSGLAQTDRSAIAGLLLKYAASSQGREQFELARKLVKRAQWCGVSFPFFGSHQLWRSWIPRFWRRKHQG